MNKKLAALVILVAGMGFSTALGAEKIHIPYFEITTYELMLPPKPESPGP